MVFPHDLICREPRVLAATLPDSNLPMPSAPLNFSVTLIGNTVIAAWDAAEVFPPRSTYEIWSAPTSLSNVESKTLLWAGDALQKSLIYATSSPSWLQVRASCGSAQASAFQPSSFGLGIAPVISQPYSTGGWTFDVAPSGVSKVANTASLTTGYASGVVVNTAATPVWSWHNPGSVDIRINSPGAPATSFTGSGMGLEESRSGAFWLNVADGGNVSSRSVNVLVYRTSGS